jgi:hypothetical protein
MTTSGKVEKLSRWRKGNGGFFAVDGRPYFTDKPVGFEVGDEVAFTEVQADTLGQEHASRADSIAVLKRGSAPHGEEPRPDERVAGIIRASALKSACVLLGRVHIPAEHDPTSHVFETDSGIAKRAVRIAQIFEPYLRGDAEFKAGGDVHD